MPDAVLWIFWCVGMLTFVSMWIAAARLLWHLLLKDIIKELTEKE